MHDETELILKMTRVSDQIGTGFGQLRLVRNKENSLFLGVKTDVRPFPASL